MINKGGGRGGRASTPANLEWYWYLVYVNSKNTEVLLVTWVTRAVYDRTPSAPIYSGRIEMFRGGNVSS